jgi:hypothetical protein
MTDEPNEDAANLDDAALLEAYLEATAPALGHIAAKDTSDELPEWPVVATHNVGLTIDDTTLAWFKSNHADWQRAVGIVLHAWVTAQIDTHRDQVIAV